MEMLTLLSEWPVAEALRRHATAYLLVNAAHILALGVLFGSVLALDLRLLGAFPHAPLALFAPPLARLAACGLGLAVVTGFLLFSVRPVAYAQNPAFLTKVALVGAGTVNAMATHLAAGWRHALAGTPTGPWLRLSAGLSIAIWTAAVIAGRWIGFL